jgi:uncharacterized protein involved in exopolysaccharide biosynthesis
MDDADGGAGEGGQSAVDPELIKSYVQFVRRAIRAHRLMLVAVLLTGIALTAVAFRYFPRTYSCTTVLMVDANQVLEGNYGPNGLVAAESLIMRRENLETIVREKGLIEKFRARRQPILALKDRMIQALVGEMSEDNFRSILVGTLEAKLGVKVGNGTLSISVDWGDGATAAEIVEAARESFVKARHNAEMAAFEEKLTILDGHASSLRDEIETLAKQARTLLEERENTVRAAARASASAATAEGATPTPRPRARSLVADDLEGPGLKEKLDAKRKRLADYDRDHEQRVQEERRKLEELKLRLTPSHPEVATAQKRLASVQQEPSEIALLCSEIQSLDGEVKQRELVTKRDGGGASRSLVPGLASPQLDPLPGDIVRLLDAGNIDPALAAQLSSAVSKYGALRDDIRTGRIQFDTAQAAFNFRYKVVIPAEAPSKPTKPKPATILGGGIFMSLILALMLPILAELRSGVIVERWQVAAVQLPVLADLRLPPAATEGGESGPPSRMPG